MFFSLRVISVAGRATYVARPATEVARPATENSSRGNGKIP